MVSFPLPARSTALLLFLFASLSSLLCVSAVSFTDALRTYYRPDVDQICHEPYAGAPDQCSHADLVTLTARDRYALHSSLISSQSTAGSLDGFVDSIFALLQQRNQQPQSEQQLRRQGSSTRIGAGNVEDMFLRTTAHLGSGLVSSVSTPVSLREERCFRNYLSANRYKREAMDTVINELFVRHVASIVAKGGKQWQIRSPTGCSEVHTMPIRGGKVKRDVTSHNGGPVFDDDMKVFHPIMGNHNEDPWVKWKQFSANDGVIGGGDFGHRKRSLGNLGHGGVHGHVKRGNKNFAPWWGGQGKPNGQAPPNVPGFSIPMGAPAGYGNGMPSVPQQAPQPGAGAGSAYVSGVGAGSGYVPGSGTGSGIDSGAGSGSGSGAGSGVTTSVTSSQPHGFAAEVTGGGSATPDIPKDIHELEKLLSDSQPRVIHLNKIFDYRGSAGVCTNCKGCIPDSYPKCPNKGQLAIDNGQGWCNGKPAKSVTYDKAGLSPISVGSNKSIIGISSDAGIRGRGLRIAHQKNVILQNFRIDEINAPFIWGGDGITLYDTDLVWIDKMTFSMIGRQFIVTGYEPARRVTISNCFFDGKTKWSATCDDSHYWAVLGYGKSDKVTFSGNYMKDCSGRSPRIANPDNGKGDSVWHVVNSVFENSSGHTFDIGPGVSTLIEGNVFTNLAQTSLHESSPGRAFAPSDAAVCSQCQGPLGRACQPNAYNSANPVPSTASPSQVLKDIVPEKMTGAVPPAQVKASVAKNAGCHGGGAGAGADAGSGPYVVGGDRSQAGDGTQQQGYGDGVGQAAPGYGSGAGQQGQNGARQGSAGSGSENVGSGSGFGSGSNAYVPGSDSGTGTSSGSGSGSGSGFGTGAYIPGKGFVGGDNSVKQQNADGSISPSTPQFGSGGSGAKQQQAQGYGSPDAAEQQQKELAQQKQHDKDEKKKADKEQKEKDKHKSDEQKKAQKQPDSQF